jgi:hypothetical protein
MLLTDIALGCSEDRPGVVPFVRGANALCDLFARCLSRLRTDGIGKIDIQLVGSDPRQRRSEQLLEVLVITRGFAWEAYWATPDAERGRVVYMLLAEELTTIAREREWDANEVARTCACVQQQGLVNRFRWPRPRASPNRQFTAVVEVLFDAEAVTLDAIFRAKGGGDVARVRLVNLAPSRVLLYTALGRLRWTSEREVELESRLGERWTERLPRAEPT